MRKNAVLVLVTGNLRLLLRKLLRSRTFGNIAAMGKTFYDEKASDNTRKPSDSAPYNAVDGTQQHASENKPAIFITEDS